MEIIVGIAAAVIITYILHSLDKLEKLIKKLSKESVKIEQYEQEIHDLKLWIDNIKDSERRIIILEDNLGIKRKD